MSTILDIESQIVALEKQIVQLKLRRNALVPLLHLPVELLVRVFEMVQEDEDTPASDSPLQIKALSSTCHQLRQVALQTPSMWATVNCWRGRWAELSAVRAGSVPLRLFLEEDNPDGDRYDEECEQNNSECVSEHSEEGQVALKAILIAARYFKRAQSASLFVPEYFDSKLEKAAQELFRNLKEPSQILRDFKLSFFDCEPLPTPFLGGSCSSLTNLSLECCSISELPYLPVISSLTCKMCLFERDFMTISTELCRMPSLKALTLENSSLSDEEGAELAVVKGPLLPLLTHLDISEGHSVLCNLLLILPVPQQSLAIRTSSSGYRRQVDEVQVIIDYVRRFWEGRPTVHGSLPLYLRAHEISSPWKWSLAFTPSGTSNHDGHEGHYREAKVGGWYLRFFQPILPRVQKARLRAMHVGGEWQKVDFPDRSEQPFLVGLKEVEFCKPTRESSMYYLSIWLRRRVQSGYPINRVVVIDGDAHLQQSSIAKITASQVEKFVWIKSSAVESDTE